MDSAPTLLRNVDPDHHHWVELSLIGGAKSPRDAVGATVYLTAGGLRQRGDVLSGGSFVSSNDPRVHFGLGDSDKVDAVEIHWPSGLKEKVNLPGVDKIFTVEEGKGVTGQPAPMPHSAARSGICRGTMNDQNMQFPHRRFDPLRGRWVLVSPHRTQRPWQGEVSRTDTKPPCITTRNAISAQATCVPAASITRTTPVSLPLTTTTPRCLPDSPAVGNGDWPWVAAGGERARRLPRACASIPTTA